MIHVHNTHVGHFVFSIEFNVCWRAHAQDTVVLNLI